MEIQLNEMAKVLRCHPRTILRHIKKEPNPYWVPDYDTEISTKIFCDDAELKSVLAGKDELLKPEESAKYLNINLRTFTYHRYEPTIRFGKIVRYSKNYLSQFKKLKDVL